MTARTADLLRTFGALAILVGFGALMVFIPHERLLPLTGGIALVGFSIAAGARMYVRRLGDSGASPSIERRKSLVTSVGVGMAFVGLCAVLVALALLLPDNGD